jgi:Secretion system C-terminal sorting domain/Bacterial Ig-like domain
MVRLKISILLVCSVIIFGTATAQVSNNNILVHFSERMDTCGFTNPNNFIWTGGLTTLEVQLIDTATALLTISQPGTNRWYTVTVSNVCDLAGNSIDTQYDTTGFILKILPVELNSFTAKIVDQKVYLNWETKTEVNNFGFDIERKSENSEWQKIDFVEGNGNSNSPKKYSFTDNNPVGGKKLFYRLKQIDIDGQFEFSNEVNVDISPDDYVLFQNYPNPFNPTTKINYQLFKESDVTIKIYDILGAEVMELLNAKKQAGVFEVEFNGQNLSSGIYIYTFQAGDFIDSKKMSLIK